MDTVTHRRDTAAATGKAPALTAWLGPVTPHLARGPFVRWPRTADGVLAAVVFVLSLVAVAVSDLADGETLTAASIRDLPVGAFVLLALAAAALAWRRSRPVTVTVFVLVVTIVWALAGYGDGHDLALAVALYSVGRYRTDHRRSLATVAIAVAVSIVGTAVDDSQRLDVLPAIVLTALPWYVGRRVRNRGDYVALLNERVERLQSEQDARERQALAEERSRIARELHDVVAHQVSMMTVQAGAARTVARHDIDAAVEAMGDVETAGRQALGELRHLLGVLRLDPEDPDDLGPQRGLADVPALATQLRHTGAEVRLALGDVPDRLPAALDLSAYRIVQESLTNIVKHAGPAPNVDVSLSVDASDLVIDIANTTTTAADLPTSGFGVSGMRERAALLGGTLTAGPESANLYRVTARLPLAPEPT